MKALVLFFTTIMILCFMNCKKQELYPPALTSVFTKNMRGPHTWKGSIYSWAQGKDSTYAIDDASFAIEVIDDTTLKILDKKFYYLKRNISGGFWRINVDTSTKLIYSPFTESVISHGMLKIEYFYKEDSIAYTDQDGGLGGYHVITYHTRL